MLVMPKFAGLSGQNMVRAFERLGFEVLRQTGSRIVVLRGVPNHKEVKTLPKFNFLEQLLNLCQ